MAIQDDISHYEVLGILPTATDEQIKHRFRKLALAHHPDKGGDENVFKRIRAAADTLLDTRLRAAYDLLLAEERIELFPETTSWPNQPDGVAAHDLGRQGRGPGEAKPRRGESDWWFQAMYEELDDISQRIAKERLSDWGLPPRRFKPFTGPAKEVKLPKQQNRFRRSSRDRLWMDRPVN